MKLFEFITVCVVNFLYVSATFFGHLQGGILWRCITKTSKPNHTYKI